MKIKKFLTFIGILGSTLFSTGITEGEGSITIHSTVEGKINKIKMKTADNRKLGMGDSSIPFNQLFGPDVTEFTVPLDENGWIIDPELTKSIITVFKEITERTRATKERGKPIYPQQPEDAIIRYKHGKLEICEYITLCSMAGSGQVNILLEDLGFKHIEDLSKACDGMIVIPHKAFLMAKKVDESLPGSLFRIQSIVRSNMERLNVFNYIKVESRIIRSYCSSINILPNGAILYGNYIEFRAGSDFFSQNKERGLAEYSLRLSFAGPITNRGGLPTNEEDLISFLKYVTYYITECCMCVDREYPENTQYFSMPARSFGMEKIMELIKLMFDLSQDTTLIGGDASGQEIEKRITEVIPDAKFEPYKNYATYRHR